MAFRHCPKCGVMRPSQPHRSASVSNVYCYPVCSQRGRLVYESLDDAKVPLKRPVFLPARAKKVS